MRGPPPRDDNERAALRALMFELSKPHECSDIAAYLGVSRYVIDRIERRALEKLRDLMLDEESSLREPARLHRRLWGSYAADGRGSRGNDDEG